MLNASNTALQVSQDTLMTRITGLESQIQDIFQPRIEELERQLKSTKELLNPLTLSFIASSPFHGFDVKKSVDLMESLVPDMILPHHMHPANGPIGTEPPRSPHLTPFELENLIYRQYVRD